MGSPGQQENDSATASVVARPIHCFPLALLLGLGLDHLFPLAQVIPTAGTLSSIAAVAAGAMILSGVALFVAGVRNFARAATPVPTNRPARVLVTGGVHRWSRNPIYVGLLLLYAGVGTAVRSPWSLVLLLPLAAFIRYGVVAREEVYLERRFGEAYREYKAHARRWL